MTHDEQSICNQCDGTGILDEQIIPETGNVVPIKCDVCFGTGFVTVTIWSSEDSHLEVS